LPTTTPGARARSFDGDRLKAERPAIFERIVIELLVKMGYGAVALMPHKLKGKSGDERLDGITKENRLDLDII
jgi:restriction system protein